MKTALITGVAGQDGAYLARHLLDRGYRVVGAVHRHSSASLWRLVELGIHQAVSLAPLELADPASVADLVRNVRPDEIYNLAAQSMVMEAVRRPVQTTEVDAVGVLHLLEAMRVSAPEARFYQASTSEMFGKARQAPQSEGTPFFPRSAYGVAKAFAHWTTVNYRESYNLFCCSGIQFNHESPLRGAAFLTRKVSLGLAGLALGKSDALKLGNLDSRRDWGYAPEYVDGMWRMLQHEVADDFVFGTGQATTVRDFVTTAAAAAGFELGWEGKETDEKGIDRRSGRVIVEVSGEFRRRDDEYLLLGDASKAAAQLDWRPRTDVVTLVQKMVEADVSRLRSGRVPE
jgi:GDPmannose 4,6-dehydratase